MQFNKEQIKILISAICDEGGMNAEMIAENMEEDFDMEYSEDDANLLLKRIRECCFDALRKETF
jgi:hypothetical protein